MTDSVEDVSKTVEDSLGAIDSGANSSFVKRLVTDPKFGIITFTVGCACFVAMVFVLLSVGAAFTCIIFLTVSIPLAGIGTLLVLLTIAHVVCWSDNLYLQVPFNKTTKTKTADPGAVSSFVKRLVTDPKFQVVAFTVAFSVFVAFVSLPIILAVLVPLGVAYAIVVPVILPLFGIGVLIVFLAITCAFWLGP
ncbi:MAG: hypothetical protein LBT98_04480 [Puniceicoccales bacterium]|jgi:hypothetical protein|nr:hypothetical protein [Puniceicoccales bacterium]